MLPRKWIITQLLLTSGTGLRSGTFLKILRVKGHIKKSWLWLNPGWHEAGFKHL